MVSTANANTEIKTSVRVAQVKTSTVQPSTWRFGKVLSRRNSQVATQLSGKVLWMAEQGEILESGDLLAKLDDSLLKLSEQVIEAEISQGKNQLAFFNSELRRLKKLAESQYSSQTQIEQTSVDAQNQQNIIRVKQAELAMLKQQIEFSNIRAPFSGVIAKRFVEVGEVVNVGDPLSQVVELNSKDIQVMIPFSSWQSVRSVNKLSVKTDTSFKELAIRQIIPLSHDRSQLIEVLLDASHVDWPVGMNVLVEVPLQGEKEVLLVPRDALIIRQDNTFVYRVSENDTAQQVIVEVGETHGDMIIVDGELSNTDRVIVRGGERIIPNSKVRILGQLGKANVAG
ncbi:efflux RND transporter periplasmic adaptor subunit [Agaribacter flavus]|uniref:Efflux RND transporter periplasmic adaptor subunit n=1 Tax=Agaribacter flavus TaxID=1902781 RepID=A0ABV7FQN9_9ALTE